MNTTFRPIGVMKSVFQFKNGTPRQPSLCDSARGVITIEKSIFNNPEHSLEGLEEYSHAWVIFIFHKNNNAHSKAKVKPPRLDGRRVGVFSTRSPYRPNNIGLSLVKIDKIQGASVHVSGIDILDGTPVIDIKPYIPEYDKPKGDLTQIHHESISLHYHKPSAIADTSGISSQNMDRDLPEKICDISDISVSQNIKELDINCVQPRQLLLESNRQDSIGENEKGCGENVCQNFDNSFADSQELENHSQHLDSFTHGHEIRRNISEGFYAVSEALEKAVKKIGSASGQCKSDPTNKHEDELCDHLKSNNSGYSYQQAMAVMEDGSRNDLLSSVVPEESMHANIHSVFLDTSSSFPETYKGGDSCNSDLKYTSSLSSDSENNRRKSSKTLESAENSLTDCEEHTSVASWLLNPPVAKVRVTFTSEALDQLQKFSEQSHDAAYRLHMFSSAEEAQKSIIDILGEEPRSVYRRQRCQDSLYYFAVDVLHVTCWFDEDTAQVVRIKPVALVPRLQSVK